VRTAVALFASAFALAGCSSPSGEGEPAPEPVQTGRGPAWLTEAQREALTDLSPAELPGPPADPTNQYLDDPRAAVLGKKFFFDMRFSGPLLDESNNGISGTLGMHGEAGKVACAGCHIPQSGFLDSRSPRRQISLGSGWTRRRAPSLLDVSQSQFLMWDGRRDAFFSQPFTPIEDPFEMNSSRLFVAQQIKKLYRDEYEAIFGALPSLDSYAELAPADAGCEELPVDVTHGRCAKPGADDDEVTRVVVNLAKAIQAYTRQFECGRSRFDAWMDGDDQALTAEEQAGAIVFVDKGGCTQCHNGPYFSDNRFHNVGLRPDFQFFIAAFDDPGASVGLAEAREDRMNSLGIFSDGYDGRHDQFPPDAAELGSFKTPRLRCVSRRPSFMHTGQYRTLEDVVLFFNRGGSDEGYLGVSENRARGLTDEERAQLVAFLRALDGDGPGGDVTAPPELPPDPAL
jgi:cytochrome c peroxidase